MDRGKAGTGASAMKWEHKVEFLRYGNNAPIDLNRTMEIELNRLGTEGWEAVGLSLKYGDLMAWPVVLLKRLL